MANNGDIDAYTQIMTLFRTQLGTGPLLTVATSATAEKIDALNFSALNSVIDSFHIMTYDFTSGSWGDAYTGHQANAYPNSADPVATRKNWNC
jgi:GH18 family chitinase